MPIEIWKVVLECTSGLHSMGASEGSYIDFLKNPGGMPYIPATLVKGVMRCEAERILRATDPQSKKHNCSITGDPKVHLCDDINNGNFGCDICKIFGSPKTMGMKKYLDGMIRVTDFRLEDNTIKDPFAPVEKRTHVVIDRNTQTKVDKHLFSENVVSAGTRFQGFIVVRKEDGKYDANSLKLLTASIYAMADYGLGGNRSRGLGAVRIAELKKENVSKDDFQRFFRGVTP